MRIRLRLAGAALLFFLLPPLLALPAAAQRGEQVQVGRDIEIREGESAGNLVCVGCSITVRGSAQDAVAVGGDISVSGSLAGDAVAVGGEMRVDGPIGGDAVAVGGAMRLTSRARVGGDAVAVGGGLERDPLATVGGEAVSQYFPWVGGVFALALMAVVFLAAFNLVLVMICYPVAGEARVRTVAEALRSRFGFSLLAGLAVCGFSMVLMGMASVMGAASPLVMLPLMIVLFVALVLGYTGLSFYIGNSIAAGNNPFVLTLLGALLITILQVIPFLGLVIFAFFCLLALGSVAMSGFGARADWLEQQYAGRAAVPPAPPPAAPPQS